MPQRKARTKKPSSSARTLTALRKELYSLADPVDARFLQGFFKTAPGQYGAGDKFLGLRVPDLRRLVREYPELGDTQALDMLESSWHDLGDGVLRYDITGTAFCWQMVRSIVGMLVDVGVGKVRPGELLGILRARDRNAAGRIGAPEGLCLWEVGY